MTEVRRLLDAGSEEERALLRAGADESPTEESVRAAARVLGLVPPAALLASIAALVAKALKWSSFHGYVLAPALVAGAIATAYAVTVHRSGETATSESVARARIRSGSEGAPALGGGTEGVGKPRAVAEPLPTPTDGSLPSSISSGVARAKGTNRAVAPSATLRDPASVGLAEQVLLVDQARSLAASGDTNGALRAVGAYERRFPHGLLAEEAFLLRIQAVAAQGDRAAAAMLAQRFRAEYPQSVHTDKIQWLLGDGSK